MKEEKNLVVCIILSLFTCGIYSIIWFITLTNDAKDYSGDQSLPSGGVCVLLTIITCGIYGLYWAYKMGKLLNDARVNNGLTASDNSVLYLILDLFGLGIVDYALMQNDLNEITRVKASGAQAQ
jgi:hypothetical protein